MKLSVFDEIINRENTASVKYDQRKSVFGRQDVLPFWVADMDFKAPQPVIDVLQKRIEHGIFGYPVKPEVFYDSIVDWIERKHGWKIHRDWILFTPGVVPALVLSVLAFTVPDDRIIVQPPVYFPFFRTIDHHGRRKTDNFLVEIDGKYEMNFDDLQTKFRQGAKMMFLCNPHNPVSRVWNQGELMKLAELCNEYNIILVSDEIHSDIIFGGHKHIPAAVLSSELAKRSVTCFAPSKTFNLAGLATSFVIIPDSSMRKKYEMIIRDFHLEHGNIFGLEALTAAYQNGDSWLKELLNYLEGNLHYLENHFKINMPEIRVIKPEGTYLVWLDFRKLNFSREDLNHFLIQEAGIGLSDGAMFGPGGQGFQRWNIACPRKLLQQGLDQLSEAIKNSAGR
jgi:cystathionine beta-lyase